MSTPPPLPQPQPTGGADDGTYPVAEYAQPTYPQAGYPQPAYAPPGGYVAAAYPPAQYPTQGVVPLGYAMPTTGYGDVIAWNEGGLLVVRKGATLPPLCVKCNEPAEGGPIKRNVSWHHPALYLLILVGILVYAIVALVVQKKGTVYLSLCARHRGRRLMVAMTAWALVLGGIAMMIVAGVYGEGWPAVVGAVMFLVGLIMALSNQTLTAARVDDHFLWLRGAGQAFVVNFPPTGRA